MTNKFLVVCFLLSLTASYCSECTDKTSLSDDDDGYICYNLKASSDEKKCMYDEKNKKCVEKGCSDLSADDCGYISYIYDESTSSYKNCIPKEDKTGCELVKCEDLTSNCGRFPVYNSQDENCVLNSGKSKCEIQKCSALSNNCENFIPYDILFKCVSNSNSGCQSEAKKCEELGTDQCSQYYSSENSDTRCILNSKTNKCQLLKCEELSSSECSKFEVFSNGQTCAPYGNNCKIQSCSDLTKEVCETVTFSSEGSRCIYSTETGCTFIRCRELKTNCGQFISLDPLLKCTYDEEDEHCYIEDKECEELSANQCDLYNTEEYLEDGGKKCVKDDGKCVLDSKKLEYSILFLFLLFILF